MASTFDKWTNSTTVIPVGRIRVSTVAFVAIGQSLQHAVTRTFDFKHLGHVVAVRLNLKSQI